jgi:hypothetical protein
LRERRKREPKSILSVKIRKGNKKNKIRRFYEKAWNPRREPCHSRQSHLWPLQWIYLQTLQGAGAAQGAGAGASHLVQVQPAATNKLTARVKANKIRISISFSHTPQLQ